MSCVNIPQTNSGNNAANYIATNVRFQIKQAAHVIKEGGLVAYPTEGVFGIGCDPANSAAVARLLAVKGRAIAKGLILIGSNWQQIMPWIGPISAEVREHVAQFWPGPVTFVMPPSPDAPHWICGANDSIAVRLTAHPIAAELCNAANMAIVSTSANRSGCPATRSAAQVARKLGSEIDVLIHGPTGGRNGPTEIRHALTGAIIRKG